MAELVFFGAALLLLHTYALYPLLLVVGNRLSRRGESDSPTEFPADLALPRVSLVVAAHNEVEVIGAKLENSLALDYPPDRLEILIGSDGSDDGTDERVSAVAAEHPRVRLSSAPRAGKVGVLNRCIPQASGDLVVLSDANTLIDSDAIRRLVRHFEDPRVGAVCGRLRLFNPTLRDYQESAYWSYESFIKEEEGRRGAVVGANGGLYALRRDRFTPLPPETIVDDFVIPLRLLERGDRVLYDKTAVAHEETTENYQREFGRRARIAAGNFQALTQVPGLLRPRAGFVAWALWSHKVLRWCAPLLMALALLSNLVLVRQGAFFQLTLALQLAFYGLAALGHLAPVSPLLRRLVGIPYYFVAMNVAIAVGFVRFVRGTQRAAWDRTARA